MRLTGLGLLVLASLAQPVTTAARELDLGVGGDIVYDSNVFSSEADRVDDVTFRI